MEVRIILALIDFSKPSLAVEDAAIGIAKSKDAKIYFLHVEPPDPDFVGYAAGPETERNWIAKKWRDDHAHLQSIGRRARKEGVDAVALQIQGATVQSITDEAKRLAADLVVMGSRRHGFVYRLFHGDAVKELVDSLACPMLIMPEASDGKSNDQPVVSENRL